MRWGFLDVSGAWVIEPAFDGAGAFGEGLAPVVRDGQCGYIDEGGSVVIPFEFSEASPFAQGMARVTWSGVRDGFIDKNGRALPYGERFDLVHWPELIGVRGYREQWDGIRSGQREGLLNATSLEEVLAVRWRKVTDVGPKYLAAIDDHESKKKTLLFDRSFEVVAELPIDWTSAYACGAYLVFNVFELDVRANVLAVYDAQSFERVATFIDQDHQSMAHDEDAGVYVLLRNRRRRRLDGFELTDEEVPLKGEDRGYSVEKVGKKMRVEFDGEANAVEVDEVWPAAHGRAWVMSKQGKAKRWGLLGPDGWIIEAQHELWVRAGSLWRLGTMGAEGLVDGNGNWVLEPVHTRVKNCGRHGYAYYEGGKAYKNGSLKGGAWRITDLDGALLVDERLADVGAWHGGRIAAAID